MCALASLSAGCAESREGVRQTAAASDEQSQRDFRVPVDLPTVYRNIVGRAGGCASFQSLHNLLFRPTELVNRMERGRMRAEIYAVRRTGDRVSTLWGAKLESIGGETNVVTYAARDWRQVHAYMRAWAEGRAPETLTQDFDFTVC
jgi:hypothetical protein